MNELFDRIQSSLTKIKAWLQEAPLSRLLMVGIPLLLVGSLLIYVGVRPPAPAPPAPASTPTGAPSQQALLTTKTVPTAVVPKKTIQLAWFYKPPQDGQLDLVARKFNFFILTYKDESERDKLRANGVTSPFAQYLLMMVIHDPGSCDETPNGNQVAYKAGDFCQISESHPDWFLLDKHGNRIRSGKDYYYMDPGNPGFRVFWLERAREMQDTFGWNDIFLDNVEASRRKMKDDGAEPAKYQDDASFQTAVQGFLNYIRQNYFQPTGKRMYGNIVSVDDNQVWGRYLQSLDGVMIESFATDWSNGYQHHEDWEQQMEEAESALAQGKTLILVAQGKQDDEKLETFAFASYLLVSNGNAVFRYTNSDSYREVWWYDNYGLDLGTPKGNRYQDKDVWKRDFSKGTVTVNPQNHTAEIVANP